MEGKLDRKEMIELIQLFSVEIFGITYLDFNPVPNPDVAKDL